MHRRAALAFISFWSFAAGAADWQVVAETKLGQLKMDRASVASEGKYAVAVLVYEFKQQQRLSSPRNSVFNKRQDDVMVDCAHPALGVRTSRFLNDGDLIHTAALEMADVKFNPAEPDSMAATVVQAVCAVPLKTGL